MAEKKNVWWAIEAFGLLLPFTARATRRQAIEDFTSSADDAFGTWPRNGVRAVKILATEIRKAAPKKARRARG